MELLYTTDYFSLQIIDYGLSLWNEALLPAKEKLSEDLLESVIDQNNGFPSPVLSDLETAIFYYCRAVRLIIDKKYQQAFSVLRKIQGLTLFNLHTDLYTLAEYQMLRCYPCWPNPKTAVQTCEQVIKSFSSSARFGRCQDTMLLKQTYLVRAFRYSEALLEFSLLLEDCETQDDMEFTRMVLRNYGWACCAAGNFSNASEILTEDRLKGFLRSYDRLLLALCCLMQNNFLESRKYLDALINDRFSNLTEDEVRLARLMTDILDLVPAEKAIVQALEGLCFVASRGENELADWFFLLVEKLLETQQKQAVLVHVLKIHNQYLHEARIQSFNWAGQIKALLKTLEN